MNPKEKFDLIVNEIERLVNGVEDQEGYITYYDKQDICEKAFAAAHCYLSEKREKNALFQFLLEKRVNEYIDERKMMAAYKCILKGEMGRGYSKAIQISGLSTQAGFIEKFKSYFIVSPEVAAVRKDVSLLLPVANWDYVSENDRFALEVARLTGYYRLNERECKLALELHRAHGIDLKEVYEYIYNYVWKFIEGERDERARDSGIEDYLRDKDVLKMYFKYHFTMDVIFGVLLAKEIKMINMDLEECSKMFLEGCSRRVDVVLACQWFTTRYNSGEKIAMYEEDYQYYMQRCNELYTYYDYILYVELLRYYNREKAFDSILPGHRDEKSIEEQIIIAEREHQEFLDNMYEEWDRATEKRIREAEQRRYEAALEGYESSYQEVDMYNPDFGEDGYMSYCGEEEDYDYEPDFDNPEWLEDDFLSQEVEDFSCEDVIKEEYENECSEEQRMQNQEFFALGDEERMDKAFIELCKKIDQRANQRKLSWNYDFNVKEYLKRKG
ncbi:MAG: hypothetical protein IKB07_08690 [Lachnospiraceae bacterium]|nr:hypothetical protein [Lachnospiraceae bacterium]